MAELLAAMRDAGWYDRPDTRTPKRYHIVVAYFRPACQPGGAVLVAETAQPAARVPEALRCRRVRCRNLYRNTAQEVYALIESSK